MSTIEAEHFAQGLLALLGEMAVAPIDWAAIQAERRHVRRTSEICRT